MMLPAKLVEVVHQAAEYSTAEGLAEVVEMLLTGRMVCNHDFGFGFS
jgi:hypothetical protein